MARSKCWSRWIVFFGLACFAAPAIVDAANVPFYWESIDVGIEVQENGDLLVTESQTFFFTGPHLTKKYRWIPLGDIDGITDVRVFQNHQEIPINTGVKNRRFWMQWSHDHRPNERLTFVLFYRVQGAFRTSEDGDWVRWPALFKHRKVPIQRGAVTVQLPTSLDGRILSYRVFGPPVDTRALDGRTVEFVTREPLPPGQGLGVQVTFQHGIFDAKGTGGFPSIVWLGLIVVVGVAVFVYVSNRRNVAGSGGGV